MKDSVTKAKLSFEDGTPSVELPVYNGTIGADGIDIRSMYGATGKLSYDPGFLATASCQSAISYIDGDKGELLYRGYPIEQLAKECNFMETCYLLLKGELPNKQQYEEYAKNVAGYSMVHEQMQFFFRGFRRDAHPMSVLVATVGALSSFYHDSLDISDPAHRELSAMRLLAKMPTLVAMSYKYSIGQPFVYPRKDLYYTSNFMRMMFATPAEDYKVNDVLVRALDRILILHADHEQNASTSTVRLAGSSGANPFACIAAGIACLWGPAHGGANEASLSMIRKIGFGRQGRRIRQERERRYGRYASDGLWPSRLQELRPACDPDARNLSRSAGRTGSERRSIVQDRAGNRTGGDGRRLFRVQKTVSERRFLFRYRPVRTGYPVIAVYRHFRTGKNRWLDRTVERNDFRSGSAHRPSTPAVCG